MPGKWMWMGCALFAAIACVSVVSPAGADTFGTGQNQFEIDFVTIVGSRGDGYGGQYTGPDWQTRNIDHSYRMGVYEITNGQWSKFIAEYGQPSGQPAHAYDENYPVWWGDDLPAQNVSWFEAAQFVNWLNTEAGHQVAYNFDHDGNLTNWRWSESDPDSGQIRHKDAFYYLPSENEWVKAAYWNGDALLAYATPDGAKPVEDLDANIGSWDPEETPWAVGSGAEELNGTYDMMGNLWEWTESSYDGTGQPWLSDRTLRGGDFDDYDTHRSWWRDFGGDPAADEGTIGFRVASRVPEPATMSLLTLGGLAGLLRRRRR